MGALFLFRRFLQDAEAVIHQVLQSLRRDRFARFEFFERIEQGAAYPARAMRPMRIDRDALEAVDEKAEEGCFRGHGGSFRYQASGIRRDVGILPAND